MRRRVKPAKVKVKAKVLVARKSPKDEGSRVRDLETRLAEAMDQQTATSEILRVISSSPTNVQPVFDAIAAAASTLCEADHTGLFRFDGNLIHFVAHHGRTLEEIRAAQRAFPQPPRQHSVTARAILAAAAVQIADVSKDPELEDALRIFRTVLSVPLIRDGRPLGAITVARRVVRSFTDTQIELLKTFAEQAVIAIENVRLFNETKEALEQQTATAEILRVISASPTDVQPVFDTIVRSAAQLCHASIAGIFLTDGVMLYHPASYGGSPEGGAAFRALFPRPLDTKSAAAVAILSRSVVHVPDIEEPSAFEISHEAGRLLGFRSIVSVPMLREGESVGAISVNRLEPGRFSDGEVELLKTFADQAVIAIENVRLFTELEGRNRDLTATSEILRVISSSPTDAQPVFDAIARSAAALCRAPVAGVFRYDGELVHFLSAEAGNPEVLEAARRAFPMRPSREVIATRAIAEGRMVHLADVLEDEGVRIFQRSLNHRNLLSVPMMRKGRAIGAINVARTEVGLFSDQEVALLETFADQAVIAIENVRLFKELEARNQDLATALDQQTATSEILKVISSSPTNVQPVFDTIVRSAVRLCDGLFSGLYQFDGERLHHVAHHNFTPEALEEVHRVFPARPTRTLFAGRAILERAVVHIPDFEADPEYEHHALSRAVGQRSGLWVPMLREGTPIGVIGVARAKPGAFSDNEIALLQTFADQAVIAIENVRLFKELEARTGELTQSVEKLTALGEVSRAVISTLDVETVLDTIVSRANQLAGADACGIYEYDEGVQMFHVRATHNFDAAFVARLRAMPLHKGEGVTGRSTEAHEPIQVADIATPGAYESRVRDLLIGAGYRAVLSVPLLREEQIIGSLTLVRRVPGEYSPEVIEVLKTFATQSALAIQNARLFREIADKSAQLEAASRHKSEFLANMSHELRTPLNAIIGFSEILAKKMFGDINEKQTEYLQDILESGRHLLSLINDILDLSKIEAGRMELEATDFDLPNAIDNALTLVRERASRRGITLGHSVDERLGTIRGDERKVKQVLLNLLSNALKFTPEGGRIDVRAAPQDGVAEISVADTGVGIAPEDQEAVFEEFRQVGTADKKVEGTGLGLALSRKFIELHGGRIWVESEVGKGSTFRFTLPGT